MSYIKGVYKKCIFNNLDNLYLVGLIKVKENDILLMEISIQQLCNFNKFKTSKSKNCPKHQCCFGQFVTTTADH